MSRDEVSVRASTLNERLDAMFDLLDRGFPPVQEMSVADAREALRARRAPVLNEADVASAVDSATGRTPVRIYQPHRNEDELLPIVVFAHGGGFVLCDLDSHDGFCRALARGCHAVVVSVDYTRAPEAVAPQPAEELLEAFLWTSESASELGGDRARIVLMGDSAGANLAAAAALMAAVSPAGPRPVAQVLLYPVLDPSCDTDSYGRFGAGHFNTTEAMRWYWRHYLDGSAVDPKDPRVSPSSAHSLVGVAPAVIVVAGRDPLRDEAVGYAERLVSDGVPVIVRSYPELFHGFVTMMSFEPAASARTMLWSDIARVIASGQHPQE